MSIYFDGDDWMGCEGGEGRDGEDMRGSAKMLASTFLLCLVGVLVVGLWRLSKGW